ncbi:hypothetical protein pEaSNUABM52_00235 [Erwinia phage pEp_SNUABM_52]|nr:hypothetical protein pEaSNUABM52_00235 [Erwinia phage pEp_SNUABM_52]
MTETCDVEKSYESMRDILIALRYMCTKRMAFPIVTANIEQNNEYLVMTRMGFQVKPSNFFSAVTDNNGRVNCEWLLKAFTRIAIYFDLKPIIVEKNNQYQPLSTRYFSREASEFAYSRHYDVRAMPQVDSIRKPRVYTLQGVNYNGVQVAGQETQEERRCEASRNSGESAQASETR